jgi:hypothetical protein
MGGLQERLDFYPSERRFETTLATLAIWLRQALTVALPILIAHGLLLARPGRLSLDRTLPKPSAMALLERTAVLTVLLMLGTIAVGLGTFRIHWLAPAVILAPLILCGRLSGRVRDVRCHRLAAAAALVLLGTIGYRLGTAWDAKARYRDRFFDEAARVVRQRGWLRRSFVTNNLVVAGNLRLRCPEIGVAWTRCPAFQLSKSGAAPAAPAIVVWNVDRERDRWAADRGADHESLVVLDAAPPQVDEHYRRLVFRQQSATATTRVAVHRRPLTSR